MIIGVCGCMPQQDSAKQYIEPKCRMWILFSNPYSQLSAIVRKLPKEKTDS